VVIAYHAACGSINYYILVCGSESWTLVMAEHIRSAEDLHDCLVLFLSRAQNPIDSEFWVSGDVEVVQQISQPAAADRGFISGGLDLVGIAERLILLSVAQGSVVFIIFTFSLIALFFFFIVLWQLFSFLCVLSCRYRDHNLEGVLPLRNVLRGVRLRLWWRWYIQWANVQCSFGLYDED
jgi:hypothetical protein